MKREVFLAEKPNPYPGTFGFHEIWHLCVCTAALTHWVRAAGIALAAQCSGSGKLQRARSRLY